MADISLLKKIYAKTDGYCHICHGKLNFSNYGKHAMTGAWHVEHSIPRAKGGTDHLNNLYPACASCNCEKGVSSTSCARAKYGNSRAPYSKSKKDKIKENNISAGLLIGGTIGLIGGPVGFFVGAAIGGMIGSSNSPRI